MKKYLFFLMAIMLATVARAADGDTFTYEGLNYTILSEADHTAEVRGGNASGEVTIPSFVTMNGSRYTVTSIGKDAFCNWSSLTSVTIPTSVTEIGQGAFSGCRSLTSVTIPNSVSEIGESAFSSCRSLTSVTIPKSVTSIGDEAFYWCSELTSVTIPNSVTSIGSGPFARCTNLNEIIVEGGNEYYCSDNGVLYNYKKTRLIQCPGTKTEFEIPNSVTQIDSGAFWGCRSLTSVTIPNSVTSIDSYAFSYCSSLTSVTIPNSVTSIGLSAFSDCGSLISVTIPNSVTSIGDEAFRWCSELTSVTIPNSVTSIGSSAFRYCGSLPSVTIPISVTSIGEYAFENCMYLRTIIDLNPTPQEVYASSAFKGVPYDAVVYIPKGSYMTYMLADGWTQFSDFREMGAFDISISASTLELAKDETAELTVTVVKDDDVTVGDHEWVSFNPEVATIEDGKVTAVAPGTTTINYTEYTIIAGIAVPHTVACEVTVTETAGIRDIVEEEDAAPADVFNLNGYQVLRNATEAEINALPAGIYIVRQGRTAKKIAVK